jgi:hypothetical protein
MTTFLFVALLAFLPFIDSGESEVRTVVSQLVNAECNALLYELDDNLDTKLDEDGDPIMKWPGAFCGWQMTDIGVTNGWSAHARVQVSIGCDGFRDLSHTQETEYWYRVNLEDGTLLEKERIDISPHLIRSGTWVPEFFDPACLEGDTSWQSL